MKKLTFILIASFVIMLPVLAQTPPGLEYQTNPTVRFAPVHVYLDSADRSLAAYQFELTVRTGEITIVGVEGGEHSAFGNPPYYDPAALMNDRIIIAAFNTGADLPVGRCRVATVHLQIAGETEPEYEIKLTVAAAADGAEIPVTATIVQGDEK